MTAIEMVQKIYTEAVLHTINSGYGENTGHAYLLQVASEATNFFFDNIPEEEAKKLDDMAQ